MKLIKIKEDHYVVVDETEIKDGDWMIRDGEQPTLVTPNFWWDFGVPYKKITHSTQPIEQYYGATDGTIPFVYHKIIELPLSEVKELIGEVDVEKKSEYYKNKKGSIPTTELEDEIFKLGYKDGYNQALEDNKDRKYTEENIEWAIVQAFLGGIERGNDFNEVKNKIIQSLQPKTEWEVELIDGQLKLK